MCLPRIPVLDHPEFLWTKLRRRRLLAVWSTRSGPNARGSYDIGCRCGVGESSRVELGLDPILFPPYYLLFNMKFVRCVSFALAACVLAGRTTVKDEVLSVGDGQEDKPKEGVKKADKTEDTGKKKADKKEDNDEKGQGKKGDTNKKGTKEDTDKTKKANKIPAKAGTKKTTKSSLVANSTDASFTCNKKTEGTCRVLNCDKSRGGEGKVECSKDYKCMCKDKYCSTDGKSCTPEPTPSPTKAPTPAPTKAPTPRPTKPKCDTQETHGTCKVLSCDDSREAKCESGKCMCDTGYCASKDGEKCVKL